MSEIEITGVFENVLGMIYSAKQKAEYQVNSTIIDLYWSIGEYVSKQIDVNGWGKSTVKALSEYILSKEPGIRGYSSQNIWRMKQFYETYKDKPELSKLLRENTYKEIEVDYLDQNFKKKHGKYTGWTAQIIQHEVDHCNGVVI